MREVQISKFKATCLAILDRVAKTGRPVLVTRFGKPVARILPPPSNPAGNWLGSMRDSGKIHEALVAPASDLSDWEAQHLATTPNFPQRSETPGNVVEYQEFSNRRSKIFQ